MHPPRVKDTGVYGVLNVKVVNRGERRLGVTCERIATSDGLVAGMAPPPANEVGNEHDEDQAGQGRPDHDCDQHVVFIHLALLG